MMNSDFAAHFSTGMRKLAASVTVITCHVDGKNYGLTASAVTALSASPPSLIACVNKEASAHPHILRAGVFCVNILAKEHAEIANVFSSEDVGTRFEIGQWANTPKGAPRLSGAAASFECELMDSLPGFSHNIFVGLITDIQTSGAQALLYGNGNYGQFTPNT